MPALAGAGAQSCQRCGTQIRFGDPSCPSCGLPVEHESLDGVPFAVSKMGDPAGFWIRFLALLVDTGIVLGIGALLWPLLFGESFFVRETIRDVNEDLSVTTTTLFRTQNWHTLMWLAYSIILLALFGTTPGKMLFKIRVYDRRANGGRRGIGFISASVRTLGTLVSGMTLLIGFIMAGFRRDRRALHDLIAGTYPTRVH